VTRDIKPCAIENATGTGSVRHWACDATGLGLGHSTDHVESFYRHARGNIEVNELAGVVGDLIERVVRT